MKSRSPLSSSCVFPFISCSWLDFLSFGGFWDRSFLLDGLGTPWFVSWPSSLGLNSQDSRVPRIKVFHVLEKTPILFDLSSNSLVPLIFWERSLGDMFTGQVWRYPPSSVGFRHRLIEICHLELWLQAVWERPVRPVTTNPRTFVWLVCLTGLTGLEIQNSIPTGLTGLC